jgi:isopenicillin N synthase-like dioxygenase
MTAGAPRCTGWSTRRRTPDKRATSSRLSIVFFHHPNYDVTVSCLPSLLKADEEPRHAPIGYSDFYRLRLDQRREAKAKVSA